MVKETPRDDFTKDDLPGWTPEEVVELNKLPHWERLAARLKVRDERRTALDGSKQGDRDE
jgi:hypothetical protein